MRLRSPATSPASRRADALLLRSEGGRSTASHWADADRSAFLGDVALGAALARSLALAGQPLDQGAAALGVPGGIVWHTRTVQLHHCRTLQRAQAAAFSGGARTAHVRHIQPATRATLDEVFRRSRKRLRTNAASDCWCCIHRLIVAQLLSYADCSFGACTTFEVEARNERARVAARSPPQRPRPRMSVAH